MQGFKVTKYNPSFYGPAGSYQKEEWTSISDIGKTFEGITFTLAEYKETENAYLAAIKLFADAAEVDRLQICDVEFHDDTPKWELKDGQYVSLSQALEICREMLREESVWCRLEDGEKFYVHIGYDYYMYIGVNVKADVRKAVDSVRRLGLFVEEGWPSPYLMERST